MDSVCSVLAAGRRLGVVVDSYGSVARSGVASDPDALTEVGSGLEVVTAVDGANENLLQRSGVAEMSSAHLPLEGVGPQKYQYPVSGRTRA